MVNNILLNPGPTNTRLETKIQQWKGSDQCHREADFLLKLNEIQEILRRTVYHGDKGQVAIMAGSGTTAMQSMITSLLEDKVVILKAGAYGQRAIEISSAYKIKHSVIISSSIEDLKVNTSVKKMYFVENETSTGEKYDLKRMCEIYPNAEFLIDSTSAFGASEYLPYSDRIISLCFCSNKCLQSTPGLGIVIWNGTEKVKERSYYENLSRYGLNKLPFTLPTQSVYALEEAIKYSLKNKSIFDQRKENLIKDLEKFGIVCVNQNPSNSVIGFVHPTKDYKTLSSFLRERGIIIYSGISGKKNSFRVSTMSCVFDEFYNKIIRSFYDSCLS